MGRRRSEVDHAMAQAEDIKWQVRKLDHAKRRCDIIRRARAANRLCNGNGTHLYGAVVDFMELTDELVQMVLVVVDNPMFAWNLPIEEGAGISVLFNSPVQPRLI